METTHKITGYKQGSLLYFERNKKKIAFDLKDLTFYRPLKRGDMKELKGTHAFFRNLSVQEVADGFKDKAYSKLMKLVKPSGTYRTRKVTNFASVFSRVNKYTHLEGYLLLDIPFTHRDTFTKPVSIYPKEVLAFMKESRIVFDSNYWERSFLNHPELVNKICTHIRRNHYMDLEVYKMFYDVADNYYGLVKLELLTNPQESKIPMERSYNGSIKPKNTPYGCEYKTLFSYLVRIHRTEACDFDDALTLYHDYLQMMREIERNKYIAKRREIQPDLDVAQVGFVGFNKVEKYPKYLRTRHDIVSKNYSDWEDAVDEVEFIRNVEPRYSFSKGSYQIVTPTCSNDVKAEGASLHHCVASYISRVMDGTTQIVFMREEVDESFITVEIRANAIVQARGYNNRGLTDAETDWLKVFAKAKNLNFRDVRRDEKMPTPPVVALQKWDCHNATLIELAEMVRAAK